MALNVELVSPTQRVWSGQATFVSARTTEGELGVLPDHSPLFGVLVDGAVSIKAVDGTASLLLLEASSRSLVKARSMYLRKTS